MGESFFMNPIPSRLSQESCLVEHNVIPSLGATNCSPPLPFGFSNARRSFQRLWLCWLDLDLGEWDV